MIKNESAVRGVCSLRMYSKTVFKNRITCKKKQNLFKKIIVLERKEYTQTETNILQIYSCYYFGRL